MIFELFVFICLSKQFGWVARRKMIQEKKRRWCFEHETNRFDAFWKVFCPLLSMGGKARVPTLVLRISNGINDFWRIFRQRTLVFYYYSFLILTSHWLAFASSIIIIIIYFMSTMMNKHINSNPLNMTNHIY